MSAPNHTVICMWSGPRNLSTAMMRSFENRADTAVWDEPFFAPFLSVTGKAHPGRKETLAAHETDPAKIAKACQAAPANGERYFFQKHMPHHIVSGMPCDWMFAENMKHFFLLRDPSAVMASYAKGRAEFDISDIGLLQQAKLYDELSNHFGDLPIISSADILAAPEAMLRTLCAALNIPFDKDMLSWPAGPRVTDGAWALYWYKSVEGSTGFAPQKTTSAIVPDKYADMAVQCRPAYERLNAKRLKLSTP